MPIAILSVHNKTGLLEFAKALTILGWTLLASGGTAKLLHDNEMPVTEVADYTSLLKFLVDVSKPCILPSMVDSSPVPRTKITNNCSTWVGITSIWWLSTFIHLKKPLRKAM